MYAFAEIQGYSKFGSYTGNGSTSGLFVYTGFKPALTIVKRTNSATNAQWYMKDNKRDPINSTTDFFYANDAAADSTGWGSGSNGGNSDFLSNGFKFTGNWNGINGDGDTYIYMAFAEQPFVTSGGVPCTAR